VKGATDEVVAAKRKVDAVVADLHAQVHTIAHELVVLNCTFTVVLSIRRFY